MTFLLKVVFRLHLV